MKGKLYSLLFFVFMISHSVSQTNVVLNGGFENWSAGEPDDWQTKTSGITMIQESTVVHSGTYSLKVEFTSTSTQKIGQTVNNIMGDTQYIFNIWVLDNDPAARFRIWGYWNLSGGGSVTLNPGNLYTSDDPNWQLYTYQTTSPTDAISLDFELRFYDVSPFPGLGTIYIDDVEILGPSANAPVISNLISEPFPPNQPIDITCDVTIPVGSIDSVALYYYSDFNSAMADSVLMTSTSGDQYQTTLQGYSNATSLIYWVKAWGNSLSSISGQRKVIIGMPELGMFHTQTDTNGLPLHLDHLTKLRGIVTVNTNVFSTSNYDFYMQDNTGGINVFKFDYTPDSTQYLEGDSLDVIGTIDAYNGKVEITDFHATIISRSNPVPNPIDVNIEDMGEEFEGRLISINNVSPTAGSNPWPTTPSSVNMDITDGTGDLIMRLIDSTYIGINPEPPWPVTVVGIGNQYDFSTPYIEGYQILPRSYGDFLTTGIADDEPIILQYALEQNYPNPFNPRTIISWQLPVNSPVKITVYNIMGQKVATLLDEIQEAGSHSIDWNADHLASGVYLYRLEAEDFSQIRKMVLMK